MKCEISLDADIPHKKVVVVGNSASGLDISTQVSHVSSGPVLVSEKVVPVPTDTDLRENKERLPEIVQFKVEDRSVVFANGRIEKAVDHIIFCTGYQYSFPFLRALDPPVVTTGQRTEQAKE